MGSHKPARSQESLLLLTWILYFYTMGLKCLEAEDKMEDVLSLPCTSLANWDAIKNEISYSNVIQRDNLMFAKKLDKNLVAIAIEGDKNAKSFDKLWGERARRVLLRKIMEEWVTADNKEQTVHRPLSALSVPGFMDVRIRVEKLLEKNTF